MTKITTPLIYKFEDAEFVLEVKTLDGDGDFHDNVVTFIERALATELARLLKEKQDEAANVG
jgi:hypothetical protein